jgi:hypothetical protein
MFFKYSFGFLEIQCVSITNTNAVMLFDDRDLIAAASGNGTKPMSRSVLFW